jgi:cobalt/nickel transport system permease protein
VSTVPTTTFSEHIPDLDLITWYAESNKSFFAFMSPWTKFAVLALLVVLVTVLHSIILLISIYMAVVCIYLIAGLPVKKLALWYTLPILCVFSLIGILVWGEPGFPLFSFKIFGLTAILTDKGLLIAISLLIKALTVVTFSLFFLMTTRYSYLVNIIERIFPTPLDQIFLLSYRFLFLTISMTAAMLKAVRSRGGGVIYSIRMQGKIFAEVFALVFIRSFDRAERVHKAMIARGYKGHFSMNNDVPAPSQYGMISIFIISLIVITILIGSQLKWGLNMP